MNWNQIHSTLNLTFSIWIKLSKLIPQILLELTKTNENETSVSISQSISFWGLLPLQVQLIYFTL